jgi:dUTP pyrophosphatase
MIIEFNKEHSDIKSPTRANPSDAGLDIYADLMESVSIEPGKNQVIPTGLRFGVPHGYMLQVCNRSSMGAKRSLIVGAHIIDSGYDGEVFIDLHNIGSESQTVNPNDKIAQVVMLPVISFRLSEVNDTEQLYEKPITISNRGAGALGSTDDKGGLNGMPVGGF